MTSPAQLLSNRVRSFSSFQDDVFQLPGHPEALPGRVKSVQPRARAGATPLQVGGAVFLCLQKG